MGVLKKFISKMRKRSRGVQQKSRASSTRRAGGVNKLRNQVIKLKLKKQKIKAQKDLWKEQMRV